MLFIYFAFFLFELHNIKKHSAPTFQTGVFLLVVFFCFKVECKVPTRSRVDGFDNVVLHFFFSLGGSSAEHARKSNTFPLVIHR